MVLVLLENIFANQFITECQEHNQLVMYLRLLQKFFYAIDFNTLLYAFVILKVKSSQDILQGLSKLDHLIKISFFQRYRKGLEKQEEVIYEEVYAPGFTSGSSEEDQDEDEDEDLRDLDELKEKGAIMSLNN